MIIIGLLLLLVTSNAKSISNVFTSLGSITLDKGFQNPYGFYNMTAYWEIKSSQNPQTGDTFSLNMPGVAEVRITTPEGIVDYFDITAKGIVIGNCNVDQSGWKKDYTQIDCTVTTSDISEYEIFSGSVEFVVVFIGGGTIDYMPYASKYTTGSNTISFNDGEVTGTVDFANTQVSSDAYDVLFRATAEGDDFAYFLAPTDLCYGNGINSGTFSFQVELPTGQIDTTRSSGYTTSELNAFDFPINYQELSGATGTYSENGTKYTLEFGEISGSETFWFSGFYNNVSPQQDYWVYMDMSGFCADGSNFNVSANVHLYLVQGDGYGTGIGISKYAMSKLVPTISNS